MFHSNPFFLGDWEITHPSSSNVIYDEQSPLSPPLHPASMFEEPRAPVTEGPLARAPICDEAEECRDMVPEKKSTLNQSDTKHQSPLQKNVNKRDPPNTHGHNDKKNFLKVENGVTHRGRSASPKKSASHYSEEHLEKVPGPLTNDPKRRPGERSPSPRKGENESCQISPRAGPGRHHSRKSRGRSLSPKKQQTMEGSKDQSHAEAKFLESESRRAGPRAGDHAEHVSDGKEKSGVIRKEPKQSQPGKHRTKSPEKKSKRMDEVSLPSKETSHITSRGVAESEKGKRATVGGTSSRKEKVGDGGRTLDKKLKADPDERMVLNKTEEDRSRESGGLKPERGSPARKTPITPGPWKVPSATKATGITGVAEKRL